MARGSLSCSVEVRKEMGRRLKQLRLGCWIDTAMAGRALGVGRQTINAYEEGEMSPSVEGIRRLTVLYHTTADTILFGPDARRR
jgi:DNA-binding XRE family transcriptional regulator